MSFLVVLRWKALAYFPIILGAKKKNRLVVTSLNQNHSENLRLILFGKAHLKHMASVAPSEIWVCISSLGLLDKAPTCHL